SLIACYAAGALAIVHASDRALEWVGQMNQFGFIFWMLLAAYLLTLALEKRDRDVAIALVAAACFFEYMSLWSYESQILLLLVFPVLLIMHPARTWRKLALIGLAWYMVPALYLRLTLQKYALSSGATYQESVMRKDLSPGAVAADWLFNI